MTSKHDEYVKKYRGIYTGTQKLTLVKGTPDKGEVYGDGMMFMKKVVPFIRYSIEKKNRALSVLDYGCGRAMHTHARSYNILEKYKDTTIFEFFAGMIQCYYCYDPAVPRYSVKPSPGTLFDLVGMSDVLEHIPEESVDQVIADAVSFLKDDGLFVATISAIPAHAHFLNEDGSLGENLHCTLKPLEWWINKIKTIMPNKAFVIAYTDSNRQDFKQLNITTGFHRTNSYLFNVDTLRFRHLYWVDK